MSDTQGNFTFDRANKIIQVNSTNSFSAEEVYSAWKSWTVDDSLDSANENPAGYDPAFGASVGGQPIGASTQVGSYFFLQNGWKIKPYDIDHTLVVSGNLFCLPANFGLFEPVSGRSIVIGMKTSSLTQQVSTLDNQVLVDDVADAVWDSPTSSHETAGTFGKLVGKLLTVAKFLGLK